MIVTIDGPAGSGKSTAARRLAARLGFRFLDTGAMYRVVGLKCLQNEIDIRDERAAGKAARQVEITFDDDRVFADGSDVTDAIRTPEVTQAASVVAAGVEVRRAMAQLQRRVAAGLDIVTEGRDQGTVVFPDADCKFYFTADPRERAVRRQRELEQQGMRAPLDQLLAQIRERDERDANRKVAPLRPAENAVPIDTTHRTADDVLALLEEIVRGKLARRK